MCIMSTPMMFRSCTARFNLVPVSDKEILLARFCLTWRSTIPLRHIGERCKDSTSIQAFCDDGKYLIKMTFVWTWIAVATEEVGKDCSRVQPIKSSCMIPPDIALELVEMIRAKVPAVTGTSTLGAPLAMGLSHSSCPGIP
jgi:hypothetical protein